MDTVALARHARATSAPFVPGENKSSPPDETLRFRPPGKSAKLNSLERDPAQSINSWPASAALDVFWLMGRVGHLVRHPIYHRRLALLAGFFYARGFILDALGFFSAGRGVDFFSIPIGTEAGGPQCRSSFGRLRSRGCRQPGGLPFPADAGSAATSAGR